MSKPKQNPNILPEVIDPEKQIASETKDSREEKFLDLLFVCKSVSDAAQKAGYSKKYSTSAIYYKFRLPSFQSKIIARFKDNCHSDLPLIQKINRQGMKRILEDLETGDGDLAAKLKHIPRQTLEIVKLLSPEGGTTVNLVNVESLQAIVNGKFGNSSDSTGSDTE